MPTKKAHYPNREALGTMIRAARGQLPVDLVVSGATVFDVFGGTFYQGDVAVHQGVIVGIGEAYEAVQRLELPGATLVPGFLDAHVHIESSLMTPVRYQEAVLPCGTTTAIWDPHEIANVMGTKGIDWALKATTDLWLDVFVMVPSCVPSTSPELGLESSGATLRAPDLRPYIGHERVLGLAEMMNFPGLLGGDADVLTKLVDFSGLKRDGHCPGLTGRDLNAYAVAGIHSCHESTTRNEAREKLRKGIHVLIREGSCAKDADELLPLVDSFTSACLGFCSDDRNPLDIQDSGHIDAIVRMGLMMGLAPAAVFRAASYAPARLYGLDDRGALAPGYLADMVAVYPQDGRDWQSGLRIGSVFKRGQLVDRSALAAQSEKRRAADQEGLQGQNLHLAAVVRGTFAVPAPGCTSRGMARVIGVIPGQILTRSEHMTVAVAEGKALARPADDLLKMTVLERHHGTNRGATAFVQGFGLKCGAIATSINHDAHNVIAVGSDDDLMVRAVEELRALDGGIVVVHQDGRVARLALPLGGLMTGASPDEVTAALRQLKALAKEAGCGLEEPFLQLSFLALPVIPALKLTDRGLVDVSRFELVSAVESTGND